MMLKWRAFIVQENSSEFKKGERVVVAQYEDNYIYIVERYDDVLKQKLCYSIIQKINPLPNEPEFYYGRIFDSFEIGCNYYSNLSFLSIFVP